ncbi:hypothetical protein L1S35_05360 [Flavobacterium sp. AS60]|uniref:hypothetical protein n=1 Tax=Flavobacterium anseongense TaxID=2910677 RepID=UPI001F45568B|nr:hypothetical protein [Flavobacterium sp. AS60]MCF6129093.1 hypothetical protein [Flavobacterium sp. AS60]
MRQNESWFENLTESQVRYRILFVLLAIGIFIFVFQKNIVKEFNWYEQNKEWRKNEFEEKYFGIVVNKGRDNRNNTFIILKDSKNKIFQNEEKIWKKIYVGDSVVKQAKSKSLYVIRGKKTMIIDLDDAYKYRDSLIRAGKY